MTLSRLSFTLKSGSRRQVLRKEGLELFMGNSTVTWTAINAPASFTNLAAWREKNSNRLLQLEKHNNLIGVKYKNQVY
jgi:hypothetical protein